MAFEMTAMCYYTKQITKDLHVKTKLIRHSESTVGENMCGESGTQQYKGEM